MTANPKLYSPSKYSSSSLIDYYTYYPYKSETSSFPYVKFSARVFNEKSLTYKEWKEICLYFLDMLWLHLKQGRPYKIPYSGGTLQILKYVRTNPDSVRNINWHIYRQTGKKEVYKNAHTEGYQICLKHYNAHKYGGKSSVLSKLWRVKFFKMKRKELYDELTSDLSFLFKFST